MYAALIFYEVQWASMYDTRWYLEYCYRNGKKRIYLMNDKMCPI